MPKTQKHELLPWLVSRPIMFAIIAFIAMTAAPLIGGLIGGNIGGTLANIFAIIAFFGATTWLVRKLPAGALDRRGFIFITNAQTFITSIAFIVSTLIIFFNAKNIMLRMLWLEAHSKLSFIIVMIALAIFYLYLCGIFIGNLYAKYRRVRTMGVGMWKTLATAPFGFCMLWIPGYLMDDTKSNQDTTNHSGWYNHITDWIISKSTRTVATLVLMIIMAGFTFGFNAILLTLGLGAIFAIWCAIVGTDKMRKDLPGIYSTIAIVINIAMIVGVIGYITIMHPHNQPRITAPDVIEQTTTTQQQ